MERISRGQGRDWVDEVKSSGGRLLEGEKMHIMYRDGTVVEYDDKSDMSKVKTYGIEGVAYLTKGGIGIAGSGFKFRADEPDEAMRKLVKQLNEVSLRSKSASSDSFGKFDYEHAGKVRVIIDKEWQAKAIDRAAKEKEARKAKRKKK